MIGVLLSSGTLRKLLISNAFGYDEENVNVDTRNFPSINLRIFRYF